jgi:predicted ATPase
MITGMQVENWKSLQDVRLDNLKPITVLIGPNSSGKSNILSALGFVQQLLRQSSVQATYFQAERERSRTLGVPHDSPLRFELELDHIPNFRYGTYAVQIDAQESGPSYEDTLVLDDVDGQTQTVVGTGDTKGWHQISSRTGTDQTNSFDLHPVGTNNPDSLGLALIASFPEVMVKEQLPFRIMQELGKPVFTLLANRVQILNENFLPVSPFPVREIGDISLIEKDARNTVLILEFMQKNHPKVYAELSEDLRWLMHHIDSIKTEADDRETRLALFESEHADQAAPTISAGTARLIAILTATYALDMRDRKLPGLVAIEEPDMAIHPLLLERFVELLRTYTEREEPRQFILTTHNPRLLDYFEPEEVRVVRRDQHGYTVVDQVPEHIRDIWLDKHRMGDAWMARVLEDA